MSFQPRIGVRDKLQLESTTFSEPIPIKSGNRVWNDKSRTNEILHFVQNDKTTYDLINKAVKVNARFKSVSLS